MSETIPPKAFDEYRGDDLVFFHFSRSPIELRNTNKDDHNVYHPDIFNWLGVKNEKVSELQEAIRKAISEGKTKVVCDYEVYAGRVIIKNFSMVPENS